MWRVCFGPMVPGQSECRATESWKLRRLRERDCADRDGNAPPNKKLCRAQPLPERGGAVGTDRGELDCSPNHQLQPVDAFERGAQGGRL
jgi:hypothetical protein